MCDTQSSEYPSVTPHLNPHRLVVKSTPSDGRGIYASSHIPRGTVIEISPVLLFTRDEYMKYGQHTVLDSYTFIWKDKRRGGEKTWALALGLGSLFNHSRTPNVSYTLDHDTMSIRYTTSQPVSDGDQLFISYGREEDLWWNIGDNDSGYGAETIEPPQVDPLIELSGLVDDDGDVQT